MDFIISTIKWFFLIAAFCLILSLKKDMDEIDEMLDEMEEDNG